MKRLAVSFIVGLCFSFIAREARADAKETWTSVRSQHFTLVGNADEREIRSVALRLEQYRAILKRLLNQEEISRTVPTTVIVFKNDDAFNPYRPLYQGRLTDVAGYFQPGLDVNYIAISAEQKRDRSFGTIFHEFVHLFVENNLRGLPLCFNEGLAEYYGLIKTSDDGKKITLGTGNPQRARLLSESKLLPLLTLFATDYESDYYNEGDQRSLFYSQSWALVHYLLNRDEGAGLTEFKRFLNLLSQGATIDSALIEAFHSSIGEIEKALEKYVRSLPYPKQVVAFNPPMAFAMEMDSSRITLAEARAYIGDLLLHLGRLDEAETYLQESLALNPNLVKAQASLGLLRVRQQRVEEAVKTLRRAAAVDRGNYLTQYYYAHALSREGMGAAETVLGYKTSSAVEMRTALNRVVELAPNFIEAYRLLAFINLARDEQLDKAEALLGRALELSPGRQDLLLILAQVHIRMLNFQAARKDLAPVAQHPDDIKFRDQASSLIEDITYAEAQASRPDYVARKREEPPLEQESLAGSSFQQQAHAAKPRLAKRFKGERVRGLLTGIECMDRGVALSVKVGDHTLRLHAAELRSVFFVTYVTGLERLINCGARAAQNLVVLTYRLSSDPRAKFDGEAIAIEFVPEDIDIEP